MSKYRFKKNDGVIGTSEGYLIELEDGSTAVLTADDFGAFSTNGDGSHCLLSRHQLYTTYRIYAKKILREENGHAVLSAGFCSFSISGFPGCCGAMIFHDIALSDRVGSYSSKTGAYEYTSTKTKKGFWKGIVDDFMQHLGYSFVIDCVPVSHGAQQGWYTEMGFSKAGSFKNSRTTNDITLFTRGR